MEPFGMANMIVPVITYGMGFVMGMIFGLAIVEPPKKEEEEKPYVWWEYKKESTKGFE